MHPDSEYIWPFTEISTNEDGSFNIQGPNKHMVEMAMLGATEWTDQWEGSQVISALYIHHHKPLIPLDDDDNDAITANLCQVAWNLDR